jgi:Fe-S-cluster containining protein
MRKKLGISSEEFLEKYSYYHIDNKSRIFVLLRMPCPFLSSEGCGIYTERPVKCRLYPVVEHFSRKTSGEADSCDISYFIDETTDCLGQQENAEWTIETWKSNQGIDGYDELHKEWNGILLMANISGEYDQAQVYIAGYDLDRFRRFIFKSGFLDIVDIGEEEINKIRTDDIVLMKFGFKYLKDYFNIEPTLKLRGNNKLQFKQITKEIIRF